MKWEGGEEGWVPARNLEYAHEEILSYEAAQKDTRQQEQEAEEEELEDRRSKSKKTTLQKELKNLAPLEGTEGK